MTPQRNRMPEHIDLLVYDLDGTLLDAFEDIMIALNHALRHFGLETYDLEEVKSFVGDGVEVFIRRALKEVPRDRMREVRELFIEGFQSPEASTSRVYPGTLELLGEMRRDGFRQAILTNKPHPVALSSCDRVGISPLVDQVQGNNREHPLKPKPEGLLNVMRRLGADPNRTLMIGDGRPDMEVAAAAGIPALGCSWGTQSATQLIEQGALRVIDSIADLRALLKQHAS